MEESWKEMKNTMETSLRDGGREAITTWIDRLLDKMDETVKSGLGGEGDLKVKILNFNNNNEKAIQVLVDQGVDKVKAKQAYVAAMKEHMKKEAQQKIPDTDEIFSDAVKILHEQNILESITNIQLLSAYDMPSIDFDSFDVFIECFGMLFQLLFFPLKLALMLLEAVAG